ncbi:DoxX family protein [Chryseobacterium shandongense]|mgnify:FL=1|jgi:putative oxidoreductase|uniref:DoxX family protein n=1 Tax=Chryseobacterium shandongense TaxID=1493872 RepID=A0A3G6MN23_9FLAO|nr:MULTISPECIES: DoxX family protein [Chryseobacterium]AZA57131.1 DoxX family protein [Chryseobacterium shandongense]AZA88846.1 DoxX family protein [Chryseobacterium shandongense]AZA97390.1 DoxX family protein [Chryseobacterium shandongense]
MEILKQILSSDLGSSFNDAAFLVFRILLGVELFRVHGLKKFRVENGEKEKIPNPLGLPDKMNTMVASLADTVVPFLIILGLGTRLAVLPTIGVTAIGYFVVHRKDSLEVRDVPYMYTLSLLLVLALGAGRYSLDYYLLNLI